MTIPRIYRDIILQHLFQFLFQKYYSKVLRYFTLNAQVERSERQNVQYGTSVWKSKQGRENKLRKLLDIQFIDKQDKSLQQLLIYGTCSSLKHIHYILSKKVGSLVNLSILYDNSSGGSLPWEKKGFALGHHHRRHHHHKHDCHELRDKGHVSLYYTL